MKRNPLSLWVFAALLCGFPILAFSGDAPLPPYSEKVYDDLKLSLGVSIDDPDRIVVWRDEKPKCIERGADKDRWAGDPSYWSEGEFVQNKFPTEYPPGTPGVNVRCSKHIRIIYGNHPMMTEEYVLGNLRLFEECLKLYYLKLGFPVPFEAREPEKRDGKKHKVDVIVGGSNLPPHEGRPMFAAAGCWGCYDDRHYGFLMAGPGTLRHTPPSGATPHELAHACQMQANVHSPGSGFWWEAHANWMMLQYINNYPCVTIINQNASFYWGHGRHYYDCWQIFEHLKDEPGFGYDFITRLWKDGEDNLYIWNKAEKLAAPRSMADEWGKMARRNVTWDYDRHEIFASQDTDPQKLRSGRVLLEPVPLASGWYRVPWAMAPQQFGYNICPLKPTGKAVTVDFRGLVERERGSDWRVSLVAVNAAGQPHYSTMWSSGTNTFSLNPEDKELYLVVSATPCVMELTPDQDYRGLSKATFPYQVRLTGAEPLDLLAQSGPPTDEKGKPIQGTKHPNGGGFVAKSAKADASAYVGPNARVLDGAQVLGNARIEDWAVVKQAATVKEDAVVSGHALIQDRALVSGHARVADYGVVNGNAVVTGRARVVEYATAMGNTRVLSNATQKGRSVSWGSRTAGSAILDGDYVNGLSVDKNTWFLWFVNDQKKVDAAEDLHGIYAQYKFEHPHPYFAWDTYGITHGLLVGEPEVKKTPPGDLSFSGTASLPAKSPASFLLLNGTNQYVELRRDIAFQAEFSAEMFVRRGTSNGVQTLFEFSSLDGRNRLALVLAANGQPSFSIRNAGRETVLVAPYLLPPGKWVKVAVSLGDSGVALFLNDRIVAENAAIVHLWDMGLVTGFLGRSLEGNFFNGGLAGVTFYSVPLVDKAPPRPNPAQWQLKPSLLNAQTLIMRAVPGEKAVGSVEYRFWEASGTFDSKWQKSPEFVTHKLWPGRAYSIILAMRDNAGNVGKPSEAVKITTPAREPKAFEFSGNLCAIEAEHFQNDVGAKLGKWRVFARDGFSEGKGVDVCDSGAEGDIFNVAAGESPRLDYAVNFPKAGKYFATVRCWAVHDGNNAFFIGHDFEAQPRRIQFEPGKVRWSQPVEMEIAEPGIHQVQAWMGKDGAQLDAIALSADPGKLPANEDPVSFKESLSK